MQRSRVLAPTLKNAMLPSSTRVFSSRRPLSSAAAVAEYSSTNSTVGAIRRRPWEQAILKACANRKQVLVSLDSVLDVSTGKRPWRISFGEANPEVQPGAEPEFARPACKSYVSNAERRRMTEGILQSAQYLHRELPVRIAYAVTELDKVRRFTRHNYYCTVLPRRCVIFHLRSRPRLYCNYVSYLLLRWYSVTRGLVAYLL